MIIHIQGNTSFVSIPGVKIRCRIRLNPRCHLGRLDLDYLCAKVGQHACGIRSGHYSGKIYNS
jgi:hypothetical protein